MQNLKRILASDWEKYLLWLGGMYFMKDYYLKYAETSEKKQSNLKMDKRVIEKADVINFLNDYKTRVLMGRK